jgi:hypothetical protein
MYVIFCVQHLFETFIELRSIYYRYVHVGLHDIYLLLIFDFNQMWNLSKKFSRFLSIRFHENSFSGPRVDSLLAAFSQIFIANTSVTRIKAKELGPTQIS